MQIASIGYLKLGALAPMRSASTSTASKIHALIEGMGQLTRVAITGGEVADIYGLNSLGLPVTTGLGSIVARMRKISSQKPLTCGLPCMLEATHSFSTDTLHVAI
jgi:hypothetical protein